MFLPVCEISCTAKKKKRSEIDNYEEDDDTDEDENDQGFKKKRVFDRSVFYH